MTNRYLIDGHLELIGKLNSDKGPSETGVTKFDTLDGLIDALSKNEESKGVAEFVELKDTPSSSEFGDCLLFNLTLLFDQKCPTFPTILD